MRSATCPRPRPGGLLLVLAVFTGGHAAGAERTPAFNHRTGLFEPPLSMLRAALDHGDRAEVARAADRIGAARLATTLKRRERSDLLVALEGAAAIDGNVRLLEAVVPLLGSSDADVAVRAARAVARMLDTTEPRRLDDWEIAPDVVRRACNGLAEQTLRPEGAIAARLAALEAVAETAATCGTAAGLSALLRDPIVGVRRAATLTLGARPAIAAVTVRERLTDEDPQVAGAAGAAWCRRTLAGLTPPVATVAAGAPPGPGDPRVLLRQIAQADSTPLEDAVEILPCLASGATDADKELLEQVRRGPASALRDRATELLDPGK